MPKKFIAMNTENENLVIFFPYKSFSYDEAEVREGTFWKYSRHKLFFIDLENEE